MTSHPLLLQCPKKLITSLRDLLVLLWVLPLLLSWPPLTTLGFAGTIATTAVKLSEAVLPCSWVLETLFLPETLFWSFQLACLSVPILGVWFSLPLLAHQQRQLFKNLFSFHQLFSSDCLRSYSVSFTSMTSPLEHFFLWFLFSPAKCFLMFILPTDWFSELLSDLGSPWVSWTGLDLAYTAREARFRFIFDRQFLRSRLLPISSVSFSHIQLNLLLAGSFTSGFDLRWGFLKSVPLWLNLRIWSSSSDCLWLRCGVYLFFCWVFFVSSWIYPVPRQPVFTLGLTVLRLVDCLRWRLDDCLRWRLVDCLFKMQVWLIA